MAKPSPATHLRLAVTHLDADNTYLAMNALGAAWNAQRNARIGELLEAAEVRAGEHHLEPSQVSPTTLELRSPFSLRALVRMAKDKGERKAAAWLRDVAWPDPRLGSMLLELLANRTWPIAVWEVCLERVVASRDHRLLAPLGALVTTGKVKKLVDRAIDALRREKPWSDELDPASTRLCVALERRLADELRAVGQKRSATTGGGNADLLRQVYAAPFDDAPRAVLADWLLEREDPQGELINLQLARARGSSTARTRKREVELIAAHHAAWLGPLAGAPRFVFSRGFPRFLELATAVSPHDAFATVEILSIARYGIERSLPPIIEAARGLRAAVGIEIAMLEKRFAQLERIQGVQVKERKLFARIERWLDTAKRPRHLEITPTSPETQLELAGLARLEALVVANIDIARWLDALEDGGPHALHVRFSGGAVVAFERTRPQGTFDRVRCWRDATRWHVGHKRAGFPAATIADAIVASKRDVTVIIDAREPFAPMVPGELCPHLCVPSRADIATLQRISKRVTVEKGLYDPLAELSSL